jgi:hypothetical protein
MKDWYDYDEASLAVGLKPSTQKKMCDLKLVSYFVKTFNAGRYHWRYRAIPASEILRLQAERLTRRRRLKWPRH